MAKDPYRYFRVEARELGQELARGVLELERANTREPRTRFLRHAHTLKGAARVVRHAAIADVAHAIEDRLGATPEGAPLERADVDALLAHVDAIATHVAALAAPEEVAAAASSEAAAKAPPEAASARAVVQDVEREAAPRPARPVNDDAGDTVRIDVRALEALGRRASDALADVASLRVDVERVGEAASIAARLAEADHAGARGAFGADVDRLHALAEGLERSLALTAERAERTLAALRDDTGRLRLVPARELFADLERAVRDAAAATGFAASFDLRGAAVGVEAHTLSVLREALMHLVRNAVAHGGQPASERRAAGKPDALAITLTVEQRGDRIAFTCADDGRGVDLAAVKSAAARRGLVSSADGARMSDAAAAELVFAHGLSTASSVTQVSGRGVGLDVVRDAARRLRGDARLERASGPGARIEVVVPASLSSVTAFTIEAGGVPAAIPLHAARAAVRVRSSDVIRAGGARSIMIEGEPMPFVDLAELLGARTEARASASDDLTCVIVVRAANRSCAVAVDRIGGARPMVVRALSPRLRVLPIVAGVALDARGAPELALDPAALVDAALAARAEGVAAEKHPPRPILVVDDSLTTRMLEQSILESAGYEVEVATSAEEALVTARAKQFGLFVVDVEMPGMSGYEFVTLTRADPTLSTTPAILVTSRGSPEDKQRGERAGAGAYIVKGEFDQVRLLDAVRELVR
jgi:two-component system chemotaxis sensor kinase CheA